jgi:FtsZ-interacting cell division protein ZipA
MGLRIIVLVAAILSIPAGLWAQRAEDHSFFGTWKQNTAKSRQTRATQQNNRVVVIAPFGEEGWTRVTLNTDDKGQTTEEHYSARFDGKDYPTLGSDQRVISLQRVDARTVEATFKRNGRVTTHSRLELSADGKTLTQTSSGEQDAGRAYQNDVRVYERQ